MDDFSNINTCKNDSLLWTHLTPGAMLLYETFFCTTTRNFYVILNFSIAVVLGKRNFNDTTVLLYLRYFVCYVISF
jgi:hypothetical protein